MNERGLIQIYTGSGKGKTTAAIGAGIRAVGQGLRVHMIQFLKGGKNFPPYGEVLALGQIPRFTLEQFGPDHFVKPEAISDKDRAIVKRGLQQAGRVLASGNYDLVILDEINVVLKLGMVELEAVLDLLNKRSDGTEVILTGRGVPKGLIDHADLVSQIQEIKHPFTKGIRARIGIEY
jgi:cob(I)alamin adenosyltransferase